MINTTNTILVILQRNISKRAVYANENVENALNLEIVSVRMRKMKLC